MIIDQRCCAQENLPGNTRCTSESAVLDMWNSNFLDSHHLGNLDLRHIRIGRSWSYVLCKFVVFVECIGRSHVRELSSDIIFRWTLFRTMKLALVMELLPRCGCNWTSPLEA